ncbi:MAG TPA: radical SAM protein [Verrucomicrobiota bacterium]|nr:radical SAM protein [Verrucomicrobiota bacterium]
MIAFGPVPSRRLGRSVGINNIPPKLCTYSCVYCQLGRTNAMRMRRRAFYQPEDIARDVQTKVERAQRAGETVDYLTFVPDGEPTLDIHLGREIDLLRPLGIKIAVITNASLIGREDVRADLMKADWVSLKVDSTRPEIWRKIDRPHGALRLSSILDGTVEFAQIFQGELVTETMLVEGVNDSDDAVGEVAEFLAHLKPATAFLSVPIRPPAEERVRAPREEVINRAYQIFDERMDRVEHLIGYEGNAFAFTGNVEEDLLSITSVHPMRQDAVNEFLMRAGADWAVVDRLLERNELTRTQFGNRQFYLRRLHADSRR